MWRRPAPSAPMARSRSMRTAPGATRQVAHHELGPGQVYTDTFTVPSPGRHRDLVTVNIIGTNDAAILSLGYRQPDRGQLERRHSTSGSLTISDADSAATFVAQTGTVGPMARSRSTRPAPGPTRQARPRRVRRGSGTPTPSRFRAPGRHRDLVTVNITGTNDAAVSSRYEQPDRDELGGRHSPPAR